jgi:hypothetical protein
MHSFPPLRSSCPSHPWLIILIMLGEEYKLWRSSLCSFPQPPVTSSFVSPNIHLSTLFSNTLSLCSSLNVRGQVSHPYRTTSNIIVLCIVIFTLLDSRHEDKRFWTEWWPGKLTFDSALKQSSQYGLARVCIWGSGSPVKVSLSDAGSCWLTGTGKRSGWAVIWTFLGFLTLLS